MTIGFDWFGTITEFPVLFAAFSKVLKAGDNKIVIITAVGSDKDLAKYEQKVKAHLAEHDMVYDEIVVVPFEDPLEIPRLKGEICIEKGVQFYFDDRRDIAEYLTKIGTTGFHVKKGVKL